MEALGFVGVVMLAGRTDDWSIDVFAIVVAGAVELGFAAVLTGPVGMTTIDDGVLAAGITGDVVLDGAVFVKGVATVWLVTGALSWVRP